MALGLEMGAAVWLGVWAGQWADDKYGTRPTWALLGTLVGSLAAFWMLYKAAKVMQRAALEIEEAERRAEQPKHDDRELD